MGNPPHLLLQLGALRCQLVHRLNVLGRNGVDLSTGEPVAVQIRGGRWARNLRHLEPGLTLEDPNHRLVAGEVEPEGPGLVLLRSYDAHGGGDVAGAAPHGLELDLEFGYGVGRGEI